MMKLSHMLSCVTRNTRCVGVYVYGVIHNMMSQLQDLMPEDIQTQKCHIKIRLMPRDFGLITA